MTAERLRQLLADLASAWSERRYHDAAGKFAPAVRYVDPLRYSLSGRDELRGFFEDDGGRPSDPPLRHAVLSSAA